MVKVGDVYEVVNGKNTGLQFRVSGVKDLPLPGSIYGKSDGGDDVEVDADNVKLVRTLEQDRLGTQ